MLGPFDKYIEKLDWPVLTLELRRNHKWTRDFGLVLMLSAIISVLGLAGLIWAYCRYHNRLFYSPIDTIAMMILTVQGFLLGIYLLFVGPPYAAKAISGEIETKRFDSLALTPLSSRQIVIQKAVLPMIYLLGIVIAMLPTTICCLIATKGLSWWILYIILCVLLYAAYCNGLAFLCSALTRNTRNATAITYLVLLFGPNFGLLTFRISMMMIFSPAIYYLRYLDYRVILTAITLIFALVTFLLYSFAAGRVESLRRSKI